MMNSYGKTILKRSMTHSSECILATAVRSILYSRRDAVMAGALVAGVMRATPMALAAASSTRDWDSA
jgi:hypothetical protein